MSGGKGVSLPDLLGFSLRDVEVALGTRNVRLVRQIDPTTPWLPLDEESLRRIVETLLAEAAAATEAGGRIRVCLKHSRGSVMLSVKEQGAGMTEGEFEARAGDAGRPAAPGAPLTLARCREAVAAMGGNLFANSAEGRGSTYYLVLPAPPA